MSYTYANRKKPSGTRQPESAPQRPSIDALRSGAGAPTSEQMGRRVDLPDAMREKMETAFGADLSSVKLYESEAVGEAGAGAITQGSNIAFAPGMLDFTSFSGQALLGHEISHVVSQARGEVTGSGFLNDRALEARADREGAMAAAGQEIAMPTGALSSVTAAPAAGPMQAWKEEKRTRQANEYRANEIQAYDDYIQATDPKQKQELFAQYEKNRKLKEGRLKKLGKQMDEIEADNAGTTSPTAQLQRARDRHMSFVYNDAYSSPEAARAVRQQQSDAFLGNVQSIMDSLSDDQLRSDKLFQNSVLGSYAGVHRRLYSKGRTPVDPNDHSGEADEIFLPKGDGRDLVGDLYTRLIGADKLAAAMGNSDNDAALDAIAGAAEAGGVPALMDRQFDITTRNSHTSEGRMNVRTNSDAMSKLLLYSASQVNLQRATDLDVFLHQPKPEPPKAEEPQRSIRETMSADELDRHFAMMQRAEELAAVRHAARHEPNPLKSAAKAVTGALQNAGEEVGDAVWSVKDHMAEASSKRKREKEEKARMEQEAKERELWTKPATRKELRLFRSVYGDGASPTQAQLVKLRKEIEMAEGFNRPVNVYGAIGSLDSFDTGPAAGSTGGAGLVPAPTEEAPLEKKKHKHHKHHKHKHHKTTDESETAASAESPVPEDLDLNAVDIVDITEDPEAAAAAEAPKEEKKRRFHRPHLHRKSKK